MRRRGGGGGTEVWVGVGVGVGVGRGAPAIGEHAARDAGEARADDGAELAIDRLGRRARRRRARLPEAQLRLVPVRTSNEALSSDMI